jgi:hypothetical protein
MSDIQNQIRKEVIEPDLLKNIKDTSSAAFFWRKVGNVCEAVGKMFVVFQGLLAFASATFNVSYLGFISGALSIVAMGLFSYSTYSMNESKERSNQLNMLLTYTGIDPVPSIEIDSAGTSDGNANANANSSLQPISPYYNVRSSSMSPQPVQSGKVPGILVAAAKVSTYASSLLQQNPPNNSEQKTDLIQIQSQK